jgi:orotate phosphoribosyltransferase-like protein
MTRLQRRAHALRNRGLTYKAIAAKLGISSGKAWAIINRERHNQNCKESTLRWIARGRVALCDMEN